MKESQKFRIGCQRLVTLEKYRRVLEKYVSLRKAQKELARACAFHKARASRKEAAIRAELRPIIVAEVMEELQRRPSEDLSPPTAEQQTQPRHLESVPHHA